MYSSERVAEVRGILRVTSIKVAALSNRFAPSRGEYGAFGYIKAPLGPHPVQYSQLYHTIPHL